MLFFFIAYCIRIFTRKPVIVFLKLFEKNHAFHMVYLELKVIGVCCHVACDVALHALYFPCV
jgi:hypothetical protein